MMLRKMGVLAFIFAALTSLNVYAAEVTLAWDPNSESDLAGYKIYYGTASGQYGTPIVIGKQTEYTVTGLTPGVTYYFAVTAYSVSGLESGFSNEVFKTMDGVLVICGDLNGDGIVNIVDLQALINMVFGKTPIDLVTGDVNKDGQVNIVDVQYLVNMVLGKAACVKK
jgi:hypothetical protein